LGALLSIKLGGSIRVVLSQSASVENAEKLHRSEIEFDLMAANWLDLAHKGTAPFKHSIDLAIVRKRIGAWAQRWSKTSQPLS
jgi:TRAP-type uncharacterized transport system substrate-binding protein